MMPTDNDIFKKLNNAVLDLQAADLQTFKRPLKALGRLLRSSELVELNERLSKNIDLDTFLKNSEATQGSMSGSANLAWPDNDLETLGIQLLLLLKLTDDTDYIIDFSYRFFYGGRSVKSGLNNITGQLIIPFIRDYKAYVLANGNNAPKLIMQITNKIFIVHGHDGEARQIVARFLEKIGFIPIILNEQANRGRTIIEKVEANSDVSFAVVLITPDDVGRSKEATELEPRARQNVLLELGYFMAKLGRDKICVLKRGEVAIPSDFAGVLWEPMDDGGGWKQSLARELAEAGHVVDWNKVMQ